VPQAAGGQAAGVTAYGVSGAGQTGFAGSIAVVLPAGHTQTVTNVLGSSKAYRLDVRPPGASRRESWLTVFTASGARTPSMSTVATSGGAEGCVIAGARRVLAAVFAASGHAPLSSTLRIRVPSGASTVVTDLRPGARFSLSRIPSGGGVAITLQPAGGGSMRADSTGTLSFTS
jgi:hypothetical protein